MTTTPTVYAVIETGLQANPIAKQGGRGEISRVYEDYYAFNSDVSTTVIQFFTIPQGQTVRDIQILTDTSLGSATIAVGDQNNASLFRAAATFTTTNTPTTLVNIGTGVGNGIVPSNLLSNQTIFVTVGTAALPASGNLVLRAAVLNN